jgi:pyruvate,water dikinase
LKGISGAPGVRTGRVRIVRHDDADNLVPRVQPGDVLVAHNAGALWGPVAPACAGVVLEVGGTFQHTMLVCREFGVPAVPNASGATTTLHDGQRVIVDGTRGWVLAAEDALI